MNKDKLNNMLKPDNKRIYPTRNTDVTIFANYLTRNNLRQFYDNCCICDWKRASIDLCHVRPHRFNGFYELENIIPLCPNHHRLFDKDGLESWEYESIQCFLWNMVNKVVPWKVYFDDLSTYLSTENGDNFNVCKMRCV